MIKGKVTLILGAGASAHLNYPMGEKLALEIYRTGNSNDPGELNHFKAAGFSEIDLIEFRKCFRESGTLSIDAFLEHNPRFMEIGKYFIALRLVRHELQHQLFEGGSGNWYYHLFDRMKEDCTFNTFSKNNITFVTFNYDRSLEMFLYTSLQNLFHRTEEETCKVMKKLRIIHIHGQLGAMPWESDFFRPYATTETISNYKAAAQGIRIIHEKVTKTHETKAAIKAIREAQTVAFLGFGFHKTNMKRLCLNEVISGQMRRGTAFGFTEAERMELLAPYHLDKLEDRNCIDFLRHNPYILR